MPNFYIVFNLIFNFFINGIFSFSGSTSIVHVLFFQNPECHISQQICQENILSLQAKYGFKFEIIKIDTAQPDGWESYQGIYWGFNFSDNRDATPTVVINDTISVGVDEIQTKLPDVIAEENNPQGIYWPDIPGFDTYISHSQTLTITPTAQDNSQFLEQEKNSATKPLPSTKERVLQNFKNDLYANSLAFFSLLIMVASVCIVLTILFRTIWFDSKNTYFFQFPVWLIPLLAVVGMGIAAYLSYIEIDQRQAICGPVGDCNSVQKSIYAKLFGILPIGILGLFGYAFILVCWALSIYGPKKIHNISNILLWGLSLFGVIFSIYLTFLEPFIIGATCVWCLSSALLMTAVFWSTTSKFQELLITTYDKDEVSLG